MLHMTVVKENSITRWKQHEKFKIYGGRFYSTKSNVKFSLYGLTPIKQYQHYSLG